MIGGLLLLINAIFISHQETLVILSKIIDLVIVPITVIMASFWYKKNIVIIGVALYFISYANEIFVEFDMFSKVNSLNQYHKIFQISGILGLVIVIAAGFERFNTVDNWFFNGLRRSEVTILFTAIVSFILISSLFILTN
jgi:hypothetical protein